MMIDNNIKNIDIYIYIYIYIYLIYGKYSATLGFMKFFCKTTIIRQLTIVLQKNFLKPRVAEYFPWIKYILLLLYDSSILDIEHSPYYIALGLTHTHKVV